VELIERRTSGRTLAELSSATGLSEERLRLMLAESERDGVVEELAGRWRLTPSAELRFGEALRTLEVLR
jgi:hypothetical protein